MKNYILWAIEALQKNGYQLTSPHPELVQQAPWSEVFRFSTQEGNIYLKKTPPALAIEVQVIKTLKEKFQMSVPVIIENNLNERCFLMKDMGIPLRMFFKQGFNPDILIKVLENYGHFQYATTNHFPLFLNMGVPDWRLAKLPFLYQELVQQTVLLKQFGLTQEEINKCQDLIGPFQNICEKLSEYNIPDTFCHCDFNDNNVLVNPKTHRTTIIDLGEVAITHPFFSLLNMLHHIKKNFKLTQQQYETLQHLAFKPWLQLEPASRLKIIMTCIHQCSLIQAMLGIYQLMLCVDPIYFEAVAREGRFARKCREWLNQSIKSV